MNLFTFSQKTKSEISKVFDPSRTIVSVELQFHKNQNFNTLLAIKNGFRLFFEDFPGYFEDFSVVKITAKSSESAEKSF